MRILGDNGYPGKTFSNSSNGIKSNLHRLYRFFFCQDRLPFFPFLQIKLCCYIKLRKTRITKEKRVQKSNFQIVRSKIIKRTAIKVIFRVCKSWPYELTAYNVSFICNTFYPELFIGNGKFQVCREVSRHSEVWPG